MNSILIIDDDASVREVLRNMLEYHNYEVIEASGGQAGIDLYRKRPADVVITDIVMPGMSGIEVIKTLKSEFPDIKIIAITGMRINAIDNFETAKRYGAMHVLLKPFALTELVDLVRRITNSPRS